LKGASREEIFNPENGRRKRNYRFPMGRKKEEGCKRFLQKKRGQTHGEKEASPREKKKKKKKFFVPKKEEKNIPAARKGEAWSNSCTPHEEIGGVTSGGGR